jgi:protein-arginine kinase activator protein McsA
MEHAVVRDDFEAAARLRDEIRALKAAMPTGKEA